MAFRLLGIAHCKYAIHWVSVKYRWRLSVNSAERTKLLSILSGSCGQDRHDPTEGAVTAAHRR